MSGLIRSRMAATLVIPTEAAIDHESCTRSFLLSIIEEFWYRVGFPMYELWIPIQIDAAALHLPRFCDCSSGYSTASCTGRC